MYRGNQQDVVLEMVPKYPHVAYNDSIDAILLSGKKAPDCCNEHILGPETTLASLGLVGCHVGERGMRGLQIPVARAWERLISCRMRKVRGIRWFARWLECAS